ncbi:sirohydrochlorin chelatase [Neobacillus vireti]|uniref:CbiX domain-containing protein n=1 Tax=Neobacillus vireti LMG 21834 TaxID=1131730 RepID=A0AB94ITU9_9BACI|nr:sirohydrochlorin chelatase [Neobacillus vireti]ETI70475.1 CbiX domain-containing protein [Neobacillus vireti LMG 21834]KLT19891.1 cobalamin biosynthesis protein CbiX [Neobacillus vireti]
MKAILYIGHGTRSEKGAGEARAFIERVIGRIELPIQEISFLELTEPLIEEGFKRCVDRGATEIIVVPLFLLAAGHIKTDIPQALSFLQLRYPHIEVQVKDPFGVQEKILDAIADLVSDAAGAIEPQDRLLIVGRGSSDPGIHGNFAVIAEGIRKRLGINHVSVCYLAAAKPRLQEALQKICNKNDGKIIVAPYLLFSGLLIGEINQEMHKRQKQGYKILNTGPLTRHQIFEDIVIERAIGDKACVAK